MKKGYRRIMAGAMAFALLCTGTGFGIPVYGAEAAVDVDESMYVNLDYYGAVSKINVVKGVSLNGQTEFTDYGIYSDVTNMSGKEVPVLGDGTVTWNIPGVSNGRFYYKCTLDPSQIVLPWDFDVSYKLNGVPVDGDKLAGASGLIEINIKADPNDNAREYYRNNLMLMVAVPVDMSKCYSVDAEGSQTQNLGETTAVVFTALPGEEGDYTVRLGTDSFETIGLIMAMVPGTVEDLEHIKDLKEAKDTWQDAGDELYDSLEQMAKSVENMREGVDQVRDGMDSAESAREKWSDSKDSILAGNDQTLAAMTSVSRQLDTMLPYLQSAKESAEVVHESMNDIVNTLGDMQDPLRKLHTRLKNIESSADGISGELPDIQKTMETLIALNAQLQASEDTLMTYLSLYKDYKTKARMLYDDEEELEDLEDYGVNAGSGGNWFSGSHSSSGGGSKQETGGQQGDQNGNNSQTDGIGNQTGGDNSQTDGDNNQTGEDSNQTGGDNNQTGGDSNQTGGDSNQTGGDSNQAGGGGQENGGSDTSDPGNGDTEDEAPDKDGSDGSGATERGSSGESGTTERGSSGESGTTERGSSDGSDTSERGSSGESGTTERGSSDGSDTSDSGNSSGSDTSDSGNSSGNSTTDSSSSGSSSDSSNTDGSVSASIERKNVPMVGGTMEPDEAAGTIKTSMEEKVAVLHNLSAQSKSLTDKMSNLMDDTSDSAKYSAEIVDNLDYLIEDLTALNDSLDVYYPDLQGALEDSKELVSRTTDALNSGISTMTVIQNTLKNSSDDFDAAARDSLRGSMDLLDKSLNILDSTTAMRQAGRTMKNTIDNELDKFDTDNRFLFMDPSAEKVSFTSDRNKPPKTLQIIMRTDEISLDDDTAKATDAEVEKVKVSPLKRMWNVLVQMWRAMVSIFKNR